MSLQNLWLSLNKRGWEYWPLNVSCFEQIDDSHYLQYQNMAFCAGFGCTWATMWLWWLSLKWWQAADNLIQNVCIESLILRLIMAWNIIHEICLMLSLELNAELIAHLRHTIWGCFVLLHLVIWRSVLYWLSFMMWYCVVQGVSNTVISSGQQPFCRVKWPLPETPRS